MESRFRKFLYARREKAPHTIETGPQDIPFRPASPQWPLTSSTPKTSFSTIRERRHIVDEDALLLRAVPYTTTAHGKSPVFTAEPVKGNGPVKLQTCRRLSTGELRPTTQDIGKAMDNIREGDYIVGRKDNHRARDRSSTIASPQPTPALSTSQSSSEPSFSPRTPPHLAAYPWSPSLSEHLEISTMEAGPNVGGGLGISSATVNPLPVHAVSWQGNMARLTLASRSSCTSTATSPSVHVTEESNATIAALLKAERHRLLDLYTQDKPDAKAFEDEIDSCQPHTAPTTPSRRSHRALDYSLDPPRINFEDNDQARRSSNLSTTPSQSPDDNSDSSSNKRVSLISSVAGSSYTVQTTMTEYDSAATRDDIRKLISEMRSTYIRALDNQAPPVPRHNPTVKKKRRNKLAVPVVSARGKSSAATLERQTWHGNHSSKRHSALKHSVEARTASHPVAGFGRLSPVEASPPQAEKRPVAHLQRADSATLGSITARIETQSQPGQSPQSKSSDRAQSKKREAGLFNLDYALVGVGINAEDILSLSLDSPTESEMCVTRPVGNFI